MNKLIINIRKDVKEKTFRRMLHLMGIRSTTLEQTTDALDKYKGNIWRIEINQPVGDEHVKMRDMFHELPFTYTYTRNGNRYEEKRSQDIAPENLVKLELHKHWYQARVRIGGTIRCLGSFPTRKAAVEAQDAFKALSDMGLIDPDEENATYAKQHQLERIYELSKHYVE